MEFYVTDGSDHAHFDGHRCGILLEAKYYLRSIRSMPTPRVCRLLDQARRQGRLAAKAGKPLEWHVASPEATQDLCQLFRNNGVSGIRVRYTRP
jgi:hypothetical protein